MQAAILAQQRAEKEARDRAEKEQREREQREQREREKREQVEREARERAERERAEQMLAAMQVYVPPPGRSASAERAYPPPAPASKGPPLKAPNNIGSYANPPPKPPMHVPTSRKVQQGPSGSAPASAAQTPASVRDAPLSAPGSGPDLALRHAVQTAWGTPPGSTRTPSAGASRIPSPGSANRHMMASRQGSAGGGGGGTVASPGSDLDFDFLERASDSSDDGRGHRSAAGSSRRLEDSRPRALRIPGSGHSTPAAAAVRQPASAPVHAAPASASGRPVASASGRGHQRGAATPFTQAIRELMGLPGVTHSNFSHPISIDGR